MNKLIADLHRKPVVPTGQVNGVMGGDINDEDFSSTDEEEDVNYESYEQNYVSEEMLKYASITTKEGPSSMSDVDGVEGIDYKNNPLNVYSQYNFNRTLVKKELPIDSFREKILHLIEVDNVLVIQGPTGCGKTTQVPQYILDDAREKQEYCNIVVTQPRRIATINVAKRVCEERGWTLGTVCGYQVGLERKISPDMILTYMTIGVLLQKIIKTKSLQQFTHIIVDEIHERNQDLDFLLLLIRRFLFTNSPRTKVILMSATIEAQEFAHYFRSHNVDVALPAHIIHVNKQNMYTKTTFYLDNLQTAINATRVSLPDFDIEKPEISEALWKIFTFLVTVIDKLDTVDPITNKAIVGSVLVFLPGINEIEEASKLLNQHYQDISEVETPPIQWDIIPLHSSLPNDELAKAFLPAKPRKRKVILSTNIAESSITVPDSYYVIDFCMTKVMTIDPITKYMSLKLEWASHVNCDQRAGRVGRIGNGRVYRLVPRTFYQRKMQARSIPEILRAPLERVVLQSKMLNLNDTPQQILALALNPPNLNNIRMTILSLKELGGLLHTCRGMYTPSDGDITFLGTVMATLPVDIHLSKLIVLGHLFSCLEEAVIMAAGCSIQNIFSIPFQQRFYAYRKLLLWADGSFSDLIALLNLYRVWQGCKRDNKFENHHSENRWCNMNLVNLKGLREWHVLVTEIKQRLDYLNIKTIQRQVQLSHDEGPLILKIITAGAFYPNFYIREANTDQLDEKEAVKVVGGRNPFLSVYLTGMEASQPGPLYIRAIKALFKNDNEADSNISVGFDGSSKVYIEFKSFQKTYDQLTLSVDGRQIIADTIPGRIPKEVYESIRKRQLNYPLVLKILPEKEAWKWAEKNGFQRKSTFQKMEDVNVLSTSTGRNCFSVDEYSPIPSLDVEWIEIKVTEQIDAGHFWANHLDSEIYLARLEEILNKTVLHGVIASGSTIKMGKMYSAKYIEDNMFYRCQVISVTPSFVQVVFVDYGNIQQVPLAEVYILPDRPECKLPPLGIECVLYGIQPSRKANPKGLWSEKSNCYWKNQTYNVLLYGKVHSVVDNIINLELFKQDPHVKSEVKSINRMMLELGYAEPAVESFLSKADHEKRIQVYKADNPSMEAMRLSFDKVENYVDFEAPLMSKNTRTIYLKGPYSPLEMKIYGCIESSGNKSVIIEGSSVNTVLLDSEPQDYHTRLLVAGYVSQTAGGERLKLRQTTLMPNIPGLPMLLTLLFCPTMRPKLTDDGTRVASILCGLGFDQYTNRSYYPSHDFTLELDTELTAEEINRINKVRFSLNQGVKLMADISREVSAQDEMLRIQKALKKDLINLIYSERRPVERTSVKFSNNWARNNFETQVLKPNIEKDAEDVWPLLWFVKLNAQKGNHHQIGKNLDDLDRMAKRLIPTTETDCLLCREHFLFIHEIREHLISNEHKERVSNLYENIESGNDDDL